MESASIRHAPSASKEGPEGQAPLAKAFREADSETESANTDRLMPLNIFFIVFFISIIFNYLCGRVRLFGSIGIFRILLFYRESYYCLVEITIDLDYEFSAL